MSACVDPILRITDGQTVIDLLTDWFIERDNWRPAIARYKTAGARINPSIADGQRLVSKQYDNAIEVIPLIGRGIDQERCIATINQLLSLGRQSADYWTRIFEDGDVWLELKPAGADNLTQYARIVRMNLNSLSYPFGQPFFTTGNESLMDGMTLTIEREPLWRGVAPGATLGPLYNLLRNPDFELWNSGVTDSQPDNWTDLETIQITGDNSRQDTAINSGQYALRVHVGGSTNAGRIKGVSQVISGTRSQQVYTIVAWVRNDGVSNGVGRILVTYSNQLELYRDSVKHGWTLYTGKITTGNNDVVAISLEILTTAANTDGAVYFDSLMFLEGDWEQEAIDGVLPYLTSSHIVNHWDQPGGIVEASDINYVDVWSVPGTEDALVRLELVNNNTYAEFSNPVEIFETIRIGMRRAADVTDFQNYFDPVGGTVDTTASSDDYLSSPALNTSWQTIISQLLTSNVADNIGRFRLFARIYDPKSSGSPDLALRLSYFIGAGNVGIKILDAITAPVRAQWCMVNLTENAGLNWDTKFDANPPGQLGYNVQASRPTGTDVARLDYVLTLPTDGGVLIAELDPPLGAGQALIADNTNSQTVAASQLRNGIRQIFSVTNFASDIIVYNGDVYVLDTATLIWRLRAGIWTNVAFPGGNTPRKFALYNGELYAVDSNGPVIRLRNDVWATIANTTRDNDSPRSFNGLLFIFNTDGTDTYINTWNGTTLSLNATFLGHDAILGSGVFNSRLYLATRSGVNQSTISVYDPNTGNWTTSATLAGPVLASELVEFKGKLYIGGRVGLQGVVYSFDGSTWTGQNITGVTTSFGSMVVWNNRLFMGTTGAIYVSDDGTTFEQIYAGATAGAVTTLYISGGALWYNVNADIFTVAEEDVLYKPANYQFIPFASPPQKRHRFFFNVDRQSFINNADDQMLVGIAFVPQYTGLRGAK